MTPQKAGAPSGRQGASSRKPAKLQAGQATKPEKELVIVTGISGAGKASALKAFEDLGFQPWTICRWNCCPILPAWCGSPTEIESAAIVVDVREGQTLDRCRIFSRG